LENYNYPSVTGSGYGDTNANTSTVDTSQKIKKKGWFKKLNFLNKLGGNKKSNDKNNQDHH